MGDGPADTNVRIVEPYRDVRLAVVDAGRLVLDLRPFRQNTKPPRETCRSPHPLFVLSGELSSPPPSQCRGPLPQVHRYQESLAVRDSHEFPHGRVVLKVKTSQNVFLRSRMIILNKIRWEPQSLELVRPVGLHKEPTLVLEDFGSHNHNLAKVRGF